MIQLRFDCDSTAVRLPLVDDLRYDREGCCTEAYINKL